VLSLCLACGGSEDTDRAEGRGEPLPLAAVPSRWADEADARPQVGVRAHQGDEPLLRGTPLVIEVSVLHSRVGAEDPAPLVIAAREGAWSNAVRLEVADERGAVQNWPLQLASEVSGPLTLDGENGGVLLFTLAPDQSAGLSEGAYQIRARLETGEGTVLSVPVALTVAAAPTQPTPEQARAASLARAGYQLALGDAARAEAEIDALLDRDPNDRIALLWKGDLLESAGRKDEALAVYEKALEAFWAANPDAEEPPEPLLARRDALLRGLVKDE
jgi:hypothetical protein